MDFSVKLIWDFRGADALAFAKHHAHHLNEFFAAKELIGHIADSEELQPMHATAFVLTNRQNMITLRDQLKPHRAEKYEPKAE